MTSNFWRGKRVFLTGHTGFKGAWLSIWLQHLGAEVTGYALAPPTDPSLFVLAKVSDGMHSIISDVRDGEALTKAMKKACPEVVLHMAAQPLVRKSYNDPVETYATNVMGTVNLLEAVRNTHSVHSVLNVTTDKCYENKEWLWGYREDDPLGGRDPYSSSKACSELVSASYRASFFANHTHDQHIVSLATARAGNVIGGGDWAQDRLVPDILKALEQSRPVIIRNPESVRPWQHVIEPLSGYLKLAQKLYEHGPGFAQAFNFGPVEKDAKPVQWIVENITKRWALGASWQLDAAVHPHEANYLRLDCAKSNAMLDWQPKWTLDIALERVVDWHYAYLQNGNMKDICIKQISQYSN